MIEGKAANTMEHQTTSPEEASAVPPIPSPTDGAIDSVTLELLASWRQQDATTDAEQLRAAEQEVAEFKKAMNDNRTATGERVLFR